MKIYLIYLLYKNFFGADYKQKKNITYFSGNILNKKKINIGIKNALFIPNAKKKLGLYKKKEKSIPTDFNLSRFIITLPFRIYRKLSKFYENNRNLLIFFFIITMIFFLFFGISFKSIRALTVYYPQKTN